MKGVFPPLFYKYSVFYVRNRRSHSQNFLATGVKVSTHEKDSPWQPGTWSIKNKHPEQLSVSNNAHLRELELFLFSGMIAFIKHKPSSEASDGDRNPDHVHGFASEAESRPLQYWGGCFPPRCVSSGEEMISGNTEAFFILQRAGDTCTQSF